MAAGGGVAPRAGLLARGDPAPVEHYRPAGRAPLLITCDHASRAFPAALGRLGLDEAASRRHIAWDIGARALTHALADRLDAPALLGGYSRLVVDLNRALDAPSCFLAESDGERVPGNAALTGAEREARARAVHEPYHAAIAARLASFAAAGVAPALLAVHSFTPVMAGAVRPWHVGVLWDADGRIARPLLAALGAEPGLVVGDNEPYSGKHPADYTVHRHAARAGLLHVCLEVRQDLIDAAPGVARWADLLARHLGAVLEGLPGGASRA